MGAVRLTLRQPTRPTPTPQLKRRGFTAALPLTLLASPALAQVMDPNMPGMEMPKPAPTPTPAPNPSPPPHDHSGMDMDMPGMDGATDPTSVPRPRPAEGSGTARLPGAESAMHGLHIMSGDWMIMAHGSVSAQYTKHTSPRGADKFYATSMAMLMAERDTSFGRIQFKSKLSLAPAMTAEGYPNLFATGETAGGEPLVDRQHPHDLFMELAARIDVNIADSASLFVYGGPVGGTCAGPQRLHASRLGPI